MTGIDPSLSFISPVLFISLYSNTLGSSSLFFPFRFSHSLGSLRLSTVSPSQRESYDCTLVFSLRWHSLFSVPSKVSIALYTLGALTPLYPMHL